MGHGHHRHHGTADVGDRRLRWAVAVNLFLTLAQIVGGVLSGSLALIADAIHNLSDALSLVIALAARRIGRRPADATMTFGYGRAELVAALVNYTTLIVIALYLAAEGARRVFDPPEVEGWTVVALAGIAFVVDAVTVLLLMAQSRDSANLRAAFLHNLADAMGSVAVIVSGTLILLYDWRLADPAATLLIAGYILWHAGRGVGPVVRILMMGAEDGSETEAVLADLRAMPGVVDIHHLHLWQIDERERALEAHVVLVDEADPAAVKRSLKARLAERHGIAHSVLEIERAAERCPDDTDAIGHSA
jgi:cobalt-zinc-cadmium efflux system protein